MIINIVLFKHIKAYKHFYINIVWNFFQSIAETKLMSQILSFILHFRVLLSSQIIFNEKFIHEIFQFIKITLELPTLLNDLSRLRLMHKLQLTIHKVNSSMNDKNLKKFLWNKFAEAFLSLKARLLIDLLLREKKLKITFLLMNEIWDENESIFH